jgi:hypothetical protein
MNVMCVEVKGWRKMFMRRKKRVWWGEGGWCWGMKRRNVVWKMKYEKVSGKGKKEMGKVVWKRMSGKEMRKRGVKEMDESDRRWGKCWWELWKMWWRGRWHFVEEECDMVKRCSVEFRDRENVVGAMRGVARQWGFDWGVKGNEVLMGVKKGRRRGKVTKRSFEKVVREKQERCYVKVNEVIKKKVVEECYEYWGANEWKFVEGKEMMRSDDKNVREEGEKMMKVGEFERWLGGRMGMKGVRLERGVMEVDEKLKEERMEREDAMRKVIQGLMDDESEMIRGIGKRYGEVWREVEDLYSELEDVKGELGGWERVVDVEREFVRKEKVYETVRDDSLVKEKVKRVRKQRVKLRIIEVDLNELRDLMTRLSDDKRLKSRLRRVLKKVKETERKRNYERDRLMEMVREERLSREEFMRNGEKLLVGERSVFRKVVKAKWVWVGEGKGREESEVAWMRSSIDEIEKEIMVKKRWMMNVEGMIMGYEVKEEVKGDVIDAEWVRSRGDWVDLWGRIEGEVEVWRMIDGVDLYIVGDVGRRLVRKGVYGEVLRMDEERMERMRVEELVWREVIEREEREKETWIVWRKSKSVMRCECERKVMGWDGRLRSGRVCDLMSEWRKDGGGEEW